MPNRYIEIVPTNVPSNGKISFKDGHPVIQFMIGASDHLLLGSSIRLCGDFQCFISTANVGANRGTPPTNADQLFADPKTGIYGTIDQLVVKNVGQFSTIEHIRSYNRMMASYIPATSSVTDCLGHFGETSLTMPNVRGMKESVVNYSGNNAGVDVRKNAFSCHLPCGMFNGQQPIFLGRNGVNGIILELHLAPDANFFYQGDNALDTSAIQDAYYEFSNLKLTAELVEPDAATLSSLNSAGGSTYTYNSISSYYTSVNSALSVINFNLGLRNVLGGWMNFLPAVNINNWRFNGLDTRHLHNSTTTPTADNLTAQSAPAFVKNLTFTRGGQKFPNNFDTETLNKKTPSNLLTDPAVQRQFMNAIVQFSKPSRTCADPFNSAMTNDVSDAFALYTGSVTGIGMAYDQVSGQGVDFSSQNFGVQVDCNLITDSPVGVFLFIHSKQTLVFNGSGLQIIK